MKKPVFRALRTMMLVVLLPALSVHLVACDPENVAGGVNSDTENVAGSGNGETVYTDSEVAVTGVVDAFGCTYANVSGYANLLPAGSGNPVFGVELIEINAAEGDAARQSLSIELDDNVFTVAFSDLTPSTEYKYRSFVTYGRITYYGEYESFKTKEVQGITSTGDASSIKSLSAVLDASVQTEGVDSREEFYVGLAWSTSKDAICSGGDFESYKTSVRNVEDGAFSATLRALSLGTTYYYASFTLIGNVYVFSSVKEFTTAKDIPDGAVDLGLSVFWANRNVGAKYTFFEEVPSLGEVSWDDFDKNYIKNFNKIFVDYFGNYFAWGDTKTTTTKFSSTASGTTYGKSISELESSGKIGSDGNLTAKYDAATANWGGSWRMPTLDEMKELCNKCSWDWIVLFEYTLVKEEKKTVDGKEVLEKKKFPVTVKGCKVTGPNGNFIILPAAGYKKADMISPDPKKDEERHMQICSYWSATLYNDGYLNYNNSYLLHFDHQGNGWYEYSDRFCGRSVRPVSE